MRRLRVCRKPSAKYPHGRTEIMKINDYEIIDGKISPPNLNKESENN